MNHLALLGTSTAVSSPTGTVTVGSAVPAGATVVVTVAWSNDSPAVPAITGVTDSRGNTYTVDVTAGAGNFTASCAIVTGAVTTPLQVGDTITLTGESRLRMVLQADAFTGIGARDQTAVNDTPGSATALSTGTTPATTAADELIIAAFGFGRGGSADCTLDAGWSGSPYVTTAEGSADRALQMAYKTVTATGTQEGTATLTVAAAYSGCIATYAAAAPSAAGTGTITAISAAAGTGLKHAEGTGTITAPAALAGAGIGTQNPAGIGTITATAALAGAGLKHGANTATATGAAALTGTGVKNAAGAGDVVASAHLAGSGVGVVTRPPRFPDIALDVLVELQIGGEWEDITADVRVPASITITRGRQDEGSRADPSTCALTINNRSGKYSPRNPLSPLYGKLGRNTPIRVAVPVGPVALRTPAPTVTANASTPNLGLTGDLDVRVEASMAWRGHSGGIAGTYVETGNQRSWIIWLNNDGTLTFWWSTDGGNLFSATSTLPVADVRHQAVRATIDVDNGAGGRTVRFSTAADLTGPWMPLGDPVVQAGTTALFDASSPLQVGEIIGASIDGRIYALDLRAGIDGAPVAVPDFTKQDEGATSFTDDLGNVWTLNGEARLTAREYRFAGEVPAWPIHWDPGGKDVWVEVEAAGIMRRLGQGKKPLTSALYRSIASADPPYVAWWPLEEAAGAKQGAGGYPGMAPMRLIGDAAFTGEPVGGVGGGLHIEQTGRAYASVTGCPSHWLLTAWFDVPEGETDVLPFLQWRTPGAPKAVDWNINTIGGRILFEAVDSDNQILFSEGGSADLRGRGPVQVLVLATGGSDTFLNVEVDGEVDIVTSVDGDQPAPITSVGINMSTIVTDTTYVGSISHIVISELGRRVQLEQHIPAGGGYVGETAGNRVARLCEEEGVPARVEGDANNSTPMGPQIVAPFLDLIGDCEAADGGLLYEARDELALRYRPRTADYNTPPTLTLDYTTRVAHPLEPVDDDQRTRNDVTVEREGGSSARVVVEDGPLSMQPPPDGVGRYDESVTLNVADDDLLLPIAGWRAHLGTVDEARYPVVTLKAHKQADIIEAIAAADVRARLHLTGLPPWEPPGIVDLIADGYSEVLTPFEWVITCNTIPGSPWRTAVADDLVLGRADTAGAILAGPADETGTGLLVATLRGPYWTTDPAEVPFDLTVGGELVTATTIGDGLVDGFDRTVADSWGEAPDGQPWVVFEAGAEADFSVTPANGARISFGTVLASRTAFLGHHCDATDVEFAFKSPVTAVTGDSLFISPLACVDQVAVSWYLLRIRLTVGGTMGLQLERRDPAVIVLTAEQIIPGVTVDGSSTYRTRFKVQDGLLQAKLWTDGDPEPDWQIRAFDSTYTAGDVGMQTFVPAGNTNTLPIIFPFAELVIHNPQKLTVARSVNGIVKPHEAGTHIRLAQQSTIAL